MANNYYDMTGVLVLDKVTPVIKALFGVFDLDENYPGNGQAYIANIAESSNCTWDSVLENLQDLAQKLGLKLVDEEGESAETVEDILSVLAEHFNASQNEELEGLMEHCEFSDCEADLDALFTIAKAFDDGHGLKAYKTEAAWYCSKPRLFEFGGCGVFNGSHVAVCGSSDQVVRLGETLEAALAAGDTDAASEIVRLKVGNLLAGIYSEASRAQVRSKLIQMLSAE